jgi:hypothetical protein
MATLKWNDGSSTQNDNHSLDTAAAAAASGYWGLWVAHFSGTSGQICSNLGSCREITWTQIPRPELDGW